MPSIERSIRLAYDYGDKGPRRGEMKMSEYLTLKTADGVEIGAYVARPEDEPTAGLVVVQEIFGVNQHIRSVADGYARDGFLAVAPALFDRVEKGVDLTYQGEDRRKALALTQKLDLPKAL